MNCIDYLFMCKKIKFSFLTTTNNNENKKNEGLEQEKKNQFALKATSNAYQTVLYKQLTIL